MSIRWNTDSLARWTAAVFESCGVAPDQATQAAAALVRSELRGYKTHGLTRVPSYVERLRAGDFNPRPEMSHKTFPGGVVLDADGAMGQIAGPRAVQLGLEALQSSASVLVAVQSCGHLGALGIPALLAAEAGAFCMVGQRTPPVLGMEGFARAAIGHNPIAFGCPLPGAAPIVFDVACSVAARGHILLAAREGKPIPAGWALDADGHPTTDAQRALEGSLLPTGGHKGIGIAMMVECLAGAMAATADSLSPARNTVSGAGAVGRQGGFVWLVKPDAFAGKELFADYMAQWTGNYLAAGGADARLPGHRGEALEREGRQQGITLPDAVVRALDTLGRELGIPLPG
ncbi:Malate/lactate/ureidoglycolate dehydrogenase, LDH2 family [Cupriavidus necator]|uniref:Ldh family oxidoreductase n=1 Tax=Cupriavidus necator (strain ATCC 17699 / DSM 428 / KCTC 22496 / NCIMB 10442 / H16 / Stanier 337) TaxID=381666 RepID=Q0KC75_CUPNH|nr:Ldh family oxidoreductase [Cupriavidus necator]QCC00292.1 Ldh family oxidoreductase [Cupriavidus necator H16]QQB76892.1 Ldh family oxidoreductase [Cupriavidus necator]WKA42148.1 Ldh family oxidoreductase [Cupriavidus necator]CAJ92396.1 Malate/L-lactate dehydrogenase [Cupriavidus necator H16]